MYVQNDSLNTEFTTDQALDKKTPPKRVRGWISIEVGVAIAFVAIMLFFIGPRIPEMFAGGRIEQAFAEVTDLILASERYRSINGNYTGISVHALWSNGYGMLKQKTIATAAGTAGDNVYGLDMQVAPTGTGGTDASITYVFTDKEGCEQILARIKKFPQIKSPPAACPAAGSAQRLAITIE
ncbi:MAG: hypothetical protein OXE41_03730 [Gammaproteobacteria bacterium]|nr:hypothetical protein [Gammaproteobacteria bacterium]MCY4274497.1 hypothetical protein [Gammaproteobacteria bacterium]